MRKRISRRSFLAVTGIAGSTLALPWLSAIAQMLSPEGKFSDYRALVCVFLFGGNDSFNMLVPRSHAEYHAYAASRRNLALAREDLLPITPIGEPPAAYGIHPAMPGLAQSFDSGRLAFIVNVGPLVQPTTQDQYQSGAVPLPSQLFSHNDQQAQWQALAPLNQSRTGWAGRVADLIHQNVADQRLTTNVSLNGSNVMQSATEVPAYNMGPLGPLRFVGLDDNGPGLLRLSAFQRAVEATYTSIYASSYANVQKRALNAAERVTAAVGEAPPLATSFPDSHLGRQLATAAKLIAVRDRLEMRRQIFFVGAGGFDTHDNQLALQPRLLADLSAALLAFDQATAELGVADSVITFTQSDFGRTLTSNGDGTDHGWGGIQLVIGGSVKGGQLYGNYPLLEIGSPLDVGGGRIIPSVSVDQYAATLARWFGIADSNLDFVAPHLSNFETRNLGFTL